MFSLFSKPKLSDGLLDFLPYLPIFCTLAMKEGHKETKPQLWSGGKSEALDWHGRVSLVQIEVPQAAQAVLLMAHGFSAIFRKPKIFYLRRVVLLLLY